MGKQDILKIAKGWKKSGLEKYLNQMEFWLARLATLNVEVSPSLYLADSVCSVMHIYMPTLRCTPSFRENVVFLACMVVDP